MTVVETALDPLLLSTDMSLAELGMSMRHEREAIGPRGETVKTGVASTLRPLISIVMSLDNKKPRLRNP